MSIKLKAPAGTNQLVGKSGTIYNVASDGSLVVTDNGDVIGLFSQGAGFFSTKVRKHFIEAPLPADLVSVKAAATPANGTITIAAQPAHPRKFQIRIVIGTTTTTAITAGTLTLVGFDQDGNAITEVISLVQNATITVKTANAFSSLTSGTVAAYAAAGSGTGNTLGIGLSNDFGLPTEQAGNVLNFSCVKVTKATKVLGASIVAVDDVAATAVVDATARTIAPTTAPAANGLVDYDITFSYA